MSLRHCYEESWKHCENLVWLALSLDEEYCKDKKKEYELFFEFICQHFTVKDEYK